MNDRYYSIEEVKENLKGIRETEMSSINDAEYELFCSAFQMLPKTTFDKLNRDIIDKCLFFVLMSGQQGQERTACILWFERALGPRSKALITLSPSIFTMYPACQAIYKILHEVAHYYIDTQREDAANDVASRWKDDYCNSVPLER